MAISTTNNGSLGTNVCDVVKTRNIESGCLKFRVQTEPTSLWVRGKVFTVDTKLAREIYTYVFSELCGKLCELHMVQNLFVLENNVRKF